MVSKFKVGDRVRVSNKQAIHFGSEYTIMQQVDGYNRPAVGVMVMSYPDLSLELVTPYPRGSKKPVREGLIYEAVREQEDRVADLRETNRMAENLRKGIGEDYDRASSKAEKARKELHNARAALTALNTARHFENGFSKRRG